MDFLDSLDLQTHSHDMKSDRMRSWYLFEQYKSLEQHQLDAAQKLRNRSLQERLLHRELTERRARRRLYDQASVSRSEPKPNHGGCLSSTTDDIYESFCELQDFETEQEFDNHSHHDSYNTFMEDFKLEEFQDDASVTSVLNVVDFVSDKGAKSAQCADKGDTDRSPSVQRTIAESIKLHLETVKENMVSLERYAQMGDGTLSSGDSVVSAERSKQDKMPYKNVFLHDNQLFCMWSRLVTFAYQIVQLNHGNCYYDSSAQLLTAVLACEALRRGVNHMCDILQPYVSPIKYASDRSENGSIHKNLKKKKFYVSKKMRNTSKHKKKSNLQTPYVTKRPDGNCHSDDLWQRRRKRSFENKTTKNKTTSQLYSRDWLGASCGSPAASLWPEELGVRRRRVQNPMLELVRYLDDIISADVDFGYA